MATATIKVGGNGNYTAWTRSDTGVSAYTLVDEDSSHDSDSTYISTGTNNNRSSFTLKSSDYSGLMIGTITGMNIRAYCKKSTGTGGASKLFFRLSGTDSDNSSAGNQGTSYTLLSQSPDRPGGGTWTADDLPNLEIGIVKDSGTGRTIYCTCIYLVVTYDELSGGETFDLTLALTQQPHSTAIAASEKFSGTLALTQQAHTTAIQVAEKFRGTFALTQQPHTTAIAALEKFVAAIALTQQPHSSLIEIEEIITAAIDAVQQAHSTLVEAEEGFLAAGDMTQQPHSTEIIVSVSSGAITCQLDLIQQPHSSDGQIQVAVETVAIPERTGSLGGAERVRRKITSDDDEMIEIVSIVCQVMEEPWVLSLVA